MTNHDESQMKRDEWIIDYLYGELDESQRRVFEQTLERDEQLREVYEAQRELDDVIPRGVTPSISLQRMQGVRWSALHLIRHVNKPHRPSLYQYLLDLWSMQISMRVLAMNMVITFAVGFLLSNILYTVEREPNAKEINARLSVLEKNTNNIVDMHLDDYDERGGDVIFSFTSASQSQVQGNLEDPHIRHLLVKALHINNNDETRLELSEILGSYVQDEDIKSSLVYTLINDPNPGVRYNAVENLVKTATDSTVRRALEHALINDVNTGIRVEAFLALTKNIDKQLLKILKEHCIDDSNTLIRERSKRLLERSSYTSKSFGRVIPV